MINIKTISAKIKLSVVVFALTVITGAAITTAILFFMHFSIDNIIEISREMEYIHRYQLTIQLQVMPANDYLISGDIRLRKQYSNLLLKSKKYYKRLSGFKILNREERALLNRANEIINENTLIAKQIFSLKNPVGNKTGNALMVKMDRKAREAIRILNRYHDIDHDEIMEAKRKAERVRNFSTVILVTSISIAFLILIFGWYFSKSIINPIRDLTQASKRVARGEYSEISIERQDEIGVLAKSFNTMVLKIKEDFITIQNYAKKLYTAQKKANTRAETLKLINASGSTISSSLNQDEILSDLLNYILDLLKLKKAAIFLYNKRDGLLHAVSATGLSEQFLKVTIDPRKDKTATSKSFTTGETGVSIDLLSDYPSHDLKDIVVRENIVGILSVPMRVKGRTIGMIDAFTDKTRSFTSLEIESFETLATNVATAVENARLHNDLLNEEKRHQEHEYDLARNIQKQLLPQIAPKIHNLQIGFDFTPAKAVGGDFYDFIPFEESRKLIFSIGDVSGKSLPAAMLTSLNKFVLKSTSIQTENIDSPVKTLNQVLISETATDVFVTLILGQFDTSAKELEYINAGHIPFLHFKAASGNFSWTKNIPQIALGINRNVDYRKEIIKYDTDDIFVFLTDGVTESRNRNGTFFGNDSIVDIVDEKKTAQEIANDIRLNVLNFCDNIQQDDITILVFKAV